MQRFKSLNGISDFTPDQFDISTLADEIRVDHLCTELLRIYYRYQVEESGTRPELAGENARGADYLLRDFIIATKRENLFRMNPLRIRQFAGNWYITTTLEPNCRELRSILQGTAGFYAFLAKFNLYPPHLADEIQHYCQDLDFYQERIDSFWAIQDDGFRTWNAACPNDS
jgi:hypothetical protein